MFYNKLNTRHITDNKKFWKTVKPLFSEKYSSRNKITLLEGNNIISKDEEVAETMNTFFPNVVKELDIKACSKDKSHCNPDLDHISNIITKFKDHPSILKIKGMIDITNPFSLSKINELVVSTYIKSLDINKPTTFNNILVRFLVEDNDIVLPCITNIYNDSLSNLDYPTLLKVADITPVNKNDDTTKKDNYRPVSILPVISKIFERIIFDKISSYIDSFLFPFLSGFRQGFSTQHCLIVMLERWRNALDNNNKAGAVLTDLSKAFDCINHDLLIAKLNVYGLVHESLAYIYSYLSERKQRTKINNSFSSWSYIYSIVKFLQIQIPTDRTSGTRTRATPLTTTSAPRRVRVYMRVRVFIHVCLCLFVCVLVYMYVCVRGCVCVIDVIYK